MKVHRPTIRVEALEDRKLCAAQLPAIAALPGLFDPAQPASHPALPATFDKFAPALSSAAAPSGAPAIAEFTRTAAPNQSIALTADQSLGSTTQTSAIVFGETTASNGRLTLATMNTVDGAAGSVTLAKSLPANSMYLLWLVNGKGFGKAVAVNRAEAWWAGPDSAAGGTSVSIYGRNLTLGTEKAKAAVYLEPGPGNSAAARWVPVTLANPYRLTIALPASLPAGNWQVWAHNGHGGNLGWSKPVALTVTAPKGWHGPTFNVKNYGAKGDGKTDDQYAIRAAVNAAEKIPSSTVFLPAGKYLINGGLVGLHDIRLLGQGMNASMILAGPSFRVMVENDATRECLIFSPTHDVELSNLGLFANGNMAGSVKDLVYARQAKDIRFTAVKFDARGYNPADIHLAHRVTFTGCQIIGKEIFTGTASQVSFDTCHFWMTNDSIAAILTWGGQQLSLTHNICENLSTADPNSGAGWGLGRFLCGNDIWGAGADVFLGGNKTIGLGVRAGSTNTNSGEQVGWEGTLTFFDNRAATGTTNTVTLAGYKNTIPAGIKVTVAIVGGKGVGQSRAVSANAKGVLTLTTPWNVVPDATSRVVVETLPRHIAVYGNSFNGRASIYQSAKENASVGVQLFEGGADVIVQNNGFHMVRTDVAMWGGSNELGPTHVNPMFSSYVANNLFDQARHAVRWCRRGSDAGLPFLGNMLRDNTTTNLISESIWVATATEWASLPKMPRINIIEGTFASSPSSKLVLDLPSQRAGGVLVLNL